MSSSNLHLSAKLHPFSLTKAGFPCYKGRIVPLSPLLLGRRLISWSDIPLPSIFSPKSLSKELLVPKAPSWRSGGPPKSSAQSLLPKLPLPQMSRLHFAPQISPLWKVLFSCSPFSSRATFLLLEPALLWRYPIPNPTGADFRSPGSSSSPGESLRSWPYPTCPDTRAP